MRLLSKNIFMIFMLWLMQPAFVNPQYRSSPQTTPLLPVQFDKTCFRVDGKPFYLISDELDYFRVPKKEWKKRMGLLKQAGGNCIATDVPWQIHEPEEGAFTFGGGGGTHDLGDFLKTAGEAGLYVIVRLGPHTYSGLKDDGLPAWLIEKYPEIRAANIAGKAFQNGPVSYIHPLFLKKVKAWYDQVCPIIAQYTILNGGPVAFVQLDNGMTGVPIRRGSLDYNPVSMGFGKKEGRYAQYLWRKYETVEKVNYEYGTQYTALTQVRPPVPDGNTNEFDLRWRKDYFDFYIETATEYAATLAQWIRENKIEVPLAHDSPDPDMNALFLETLRQMGKTFLLGSNHDFNPKPRQPQGDAAPPYAVDVFCSLEMLRLMGLPPTVLEMPFDNRPSISPEYAKACDATHLAFGMKGFNHSIFSETPGPSGAGMTADAADRCNAQKDLARFIRKYSWLTEAVREYDCRFTLDFEMIRAAHYWKNRGKYALSGSEAWDFLRRGLLPSVLCAGLSPVFCDLASENWVADTSTPVVVVSSPAMSVSKQMRIVDFLKKGGRILLGPVVPTLDDRFNSCPLLQEFLGNPEIEPLHEASSRVNVGPVLDVAKSDVFATRKLPARAEVLGSDKRSNKPVVWRLKTEGNGEVIFLGLRWTHSQQEQYRLTKYVMDKLGLQQKVRCSNPHVWTSWRSFGKKSILFVLNVSSEPAETDIHYLRGTAYKPAAKGKIILAPMEVQCVEIK